MPPPPSPLPFLALLLLLAPAAPAGDPPPALGPANRDYDQVHLALRVTPRIAEGTIEGEAAVTFASLADPLRDLRLHCEDTQVLSVRDGTGAALEWALGNGVLSVRLPAPLPRGAEGTVAVAYRSRPTRGMYFHAPSPAAPSVPLEMYSQGEGTDNRRWFPCYDEPDDRCTVEVFATVPEDLKTVSNGTLVGTRGAGGGLREDHWRLEQRVPSYLVSLIAGRFETAADRWREVPLEYNAQAGRLAELRNGCEGTPAMMEFFSEYTGRAYPYPRYAQTTVWDFVYGGMENASATTMNMRLLHPADARPVYSGDGLVAHELAHQWFGDLLTCRTWDHLWLNEGFATYFADLFVEHRDGPGEFAVERREQNRRYMDGAREPSRLGLAPSPRGDLPLELFGGKQYSRGAAVLHQLRIEVGDGPFREGIRRYVKDHADAAVVSEDFRRSMEAACGRDLGWFFEQWVYGAGYPVLAVSWEAAGPAVRVVVEQVQEEAGGQRGEFRLTVPVLAAGAAGPVRASLDVRRRRQVFEVPCADPRFLRVGEVGGLFARVRLRQGREAWAKALLLDPDVAGRMDAVEALAEWPDLAAPDLAAALARDPSWAVRREAARALGALAGKEPLDALVAALADPDARVRVAAAEALGGRTREEAGALLSGLAASDPSPYVRSEAARAAGRVRADGAFSLLSGLLRTESHRETVRQGALDGLRALGDPRALDLARPLLRYDWPRGDNFGMREAALRVLLSLAPDEPSTRRAIADLLEDPFHRMRALAAETAGRYGVREAEEGLKRLAEKDPHEAVKEAAKKALESLAPRKGQ